MKLRCCRQVVLEKEARIRRTATDTKDAEAEMEMAESLGTKGLVDAVDSLPALLKQKKMLVMHADVLQVCDLARSDTILFLGP